jgi:hypothetical protein
VQGEQILARYCFVLALFEEVYREGLTGRAQYGPLLSSAPKSSVEELLAIPLDGWIEDICVMSWLFYDQCHDLLHLSAHLNPGFVGSGDVGGADADLIVDRCLFEIKASFQPKIEPDWLWQLVGYLLLDYGDAYQVTTGGIYMVRQGILFRRPVEEFLCKLTGEPQVSLAPLRQEFRARFSKGPLAGNR